MSKFKEGDVVILQLGNYGKGLNSGIRYGQIFVGEAVVRGESDAQGWVWVSWPDNNDNSFLEEDLILAETETDRVFKKLKNEVKQNG